jgi:hypothetical protein
MYVEPESMDEIEPRDDYERELRKAIRRQPAPPGLKLRVMQRRKQESARRVHGRAIWWQRLATSALLAAAVGGALTWRNTEQRRKGEEAKRQVFTALRITNHALEQMNAQLNERNTKE